MSPRGTGRLPGTAQRPHRVRDDRRPRRPHRLRSLLGGSGLLVRRRARRDGLLLLLTWALVTTSALLTLLAPRQVGAALDTGAQQAVREIGREADTVLVADAFDIQGFVRHAARVADSLPPGLAATSAGPVMSVAAAPVPVTAVDGRAVPPEDMISVAPALLTPEHAERTSLVEGVLPTDTAVVGEPFEAAVPQAWATEAGIEVGDLLELVSVIEVFDATGSQDLQPTVVEVTAIVRATDASDVVWTDVPELWQSAPDLDEHPVPLLAGPAVAGQLAFSAAGQVTGTLRIPAVPDAYTAELAPVVADELDVLEGNPAALVATPTPFALRDSSLAATLAAFEASSRAARAQMAMALAGVIGTAVLVIVLTTRLLVTRRAPGVALERARGASVGSVVVRTTVESALLTLLAVAAAVGVTVALPGAGAGTAWPPLGAVLPVVVVGVLAGPVQTAILARAQWTARRTPANPRDRRRLARRLAARRVSVELGFLALAAASVVALRDRGLLQTTTAGTDPFLAAAPVLLGAAVTLLAVRVQPWPVRVVAGLARRTRGPLGLVGAARARRAVAVLPLLALTLGAAVAVSSALLLDTIRTGQVVASWERVGADARVDLTQVPRDDVETLDETIAAAPGVDAVTTAAVSAEATLEVGPRDETVTALALDEGYAQALAGLPSAGDDLSELVDLPGTTGAGVLPVVVDESLAARLRGADLMVTFRGERIPVEVVGTTDHAPFGQFPGPFVYLDAGSVEDLLDEPLVRDVVWVHGPGAAAAVEPVSTAATIRTQWLAERRELGLVGGAQSLLAGALGVTLLLAAIGLVVTVVAGARERGTTLALLRTLGMRPRLGWWLAGAELLPLVLTALAAGAVSGVLVVLLLGPAIGLQTMTGGVAAPALTIAPAAVVGIAAAGLALLVLAVVVEVLAHRRAGLHEVLRVGGTE